MLAANSKCITLQTTMAVATFTGYMSCTPVKLLLNNVKFCKLRSSDQVLGSSPAEILGYNESSLPLGFSSAVRASL